MSPVTVPGGATLYRTHMDPYNTAPTKPDPWRTVRTVKERKP